MDSPAILPKDFLDGSHFRQLHGEYQTGNAALALTAWRKLLSEEVFAPRQRQRIDQTLARQSDYEASALAEAWLPGRLQSIPPRPLRTKEPLFPSRLGWPHILLDGAHNPHGMAALGLTLAKQGIGPAAVIFACMADKDIEHMLPHLRTLATGPIYVPPIQGNPRAMPPQELAALIGLNATPASSMKEALEAACSLLAERFSEVFAPAPCKNPLLVCGSLYLLGEFFALRPDCLEAKGSAPGNPLAKGSALGTRWGK